MRVWLNWLDSDSSLRVWLQDAVLRAERLSNLDAMIHGEGAADRVPTLPAAFCFSCIPRPQAGVMLAFCWRVARSPAQPLPKRCFLPLFVSLLVFP